jgi:hypothetical protein
MSQAARITAGTTSQANGKAFEMDMDCASHKRELNDLETIGPASVQLLKRSAIQ